MDTSITYTYACYIVHLSIHITYICKCICVYIAMFMNNCVRVRAGNVTFLTIDGSVFIVESIDKTISDS